ncbi:MAG: metalloregulator ArsR/SmtB family transcription factor [Ectothiorhodospiraceae bacterium]|jgi:DNA-binding transcriptional ArsR family regulator
MELTDETLEVVAEQFRALAEPQRLRLLYRLKSGERTVAELVAATGLSQPNVSKHLRVLRSNGLVARRSEGNCAYFRIAAPFVFTVCDTVCDELREADARRAAMWSARSGRS